MRIGGAALVFALALVSRSASAANGNKPRIPVVWSESECITIVDRSSVSVVHFEYAVPEEDLGPRTPDEVGDSRTQQFFAFARLDYASASSSQKLPRWISQADIDRSALIDPMVMPTTISPDELLETTSRFASADWLRITADDSRVPISNAQAAMGVDWDISGVAPGTYTIWGYTWEPVLNLWSPRAGAVKIIASAAEAAAAGPSVVLLPDTAQILSGEPHRVLGCVDAVDGSLLTLEWGSAEGTAEPAWQVVVEDEPITSGTLELDFVPPSTAAGASVVKLRATVTDPQGRTYVAYSPGSLAVMPGADDPSDDGGGGCGLASSGVASRDALALIFVLCCPRRRRRRS